MLFLIFLMLFIFLVVSNVVRYGLAALVNWARPVKPVLRDYNYLPTVSVILPCYNEGTAVYETIKSLSQLDYPRERFEILAQDDCSVDDSYAWMLRAQEDFKEVRIRLNRNHKNSGKAKTICNALPQSQAEIIMSIARTASSTQSAFAN